MKVKFSLSFYKFPSEITEVKEYEDWEVEEMSEEDLDSFLEEELENWVYEQIHYTKEIIEK